MAVYTIVAPADCKVLEAHKDIIAPKYRRAIASIVSRTIDEALIETFNSLARTRTPMIDSFDIAFGVRAPSKDVVTRAFYDNDFMRKLLATTIVVAQKLTQPDKLTLATVAEEIAFSRYIGHGFAEYEAAHDDEGLSDEDCDAFDSLIATFVSDRRVNEFYYSSRTGHTPDSEALADLWSSTDHWFEKRKRGQNGIPFHPLPIAINHDHMR